ncbi:hypothetical protein [Leptospira chreensis]|uniref:hypothetical protein n=1 Tax=Leptospira chreensis TaxID=2810035 RepID=UPI001E62884B|nr:hypothetical protein [Leptospira chreensis]
MFKKRKKEIRLRFEKGGRRKNIGNGRMGRSGSSFALILVLVADFFESSRDFVFLGDLDFIPLKNKIFNLPQAHKTKNS